LNFEILLRWGRKVRKSVYRCGVLRNTGMFKAVYLVGFHSSPQLSWHGDYHMGWRIRKSQFDFRWEQKFFSSPHCPVRKWGQPNPFCTVYRGLFLLV